MRPQTGTADHIAQATGEHALGSTPRTGVVADASRPLPGLMWFGRRAATGRAIVVAVGGEINSATATAIRDALQQASQSDRDIIVDVSELTFLHHTGLAAMVIALAAGP